jgi:hypothetical protein
MQHLKNERGMAFIVEIILVVVVLAVVGVAMYASTQAKKTSVSSTTPTPSASKAPTATPAKPANEVDIPELGLKMTISDGLKDLKYEATLELPGDVDGVHYKVSTVQFTTKSLEVSDSNCSAKNSAIGGFAKYPFDPKAKGIMGIGKVKQVGQNYLTFVHPQSTCSSNAAVVGTENAMIDLLSNAFDTVTPLQ